jgi:S-DNA-T family DNA segregation ATPase FtsK/SpoIIIE
VDDNHDVEDLVEAARLLIESQFGSTSMLQRKMRIRFHTATRLMARMEQLKIVGPNKGGPLARDVLVEKKDVEFALDRVRASA